VKLPSKNRRKAQQKLSRFQRRIAVKRKAYQWQVAQKIVRKTDAVAIDNLNMVGMIKRCQPIVFRVAPRHTSQQCSASH
jgi:putative transposase